MLPCFSHCFREETTPAISGRTDNECLSRALHNALWWHTKHSPHYSPQNVSIWWWCEGMSHQGPAELYALLQNNKVLHCYSAAFTSSWLLYCTHNDYEFLLALYNGCRLTFLQHTWWYTIFTHLQLVFQASTPLEKELVYPETVLMCYWQGSLQGSQHLPAAVWVVSEAMTSVMHSATLWINSCKWDQLIMVKQHWDVL